MNAQGNGELPVLDRLLEQTLGQFGDATLVNLWQLLGPRDAIIRGGPFGLRDYFPYKPSVSLRTQFDVWRTIAIGRWLWETNPSAVGLLQSMASYIIGAGLTVKAGPASRNPASQQRVDAVQQWVDELCEREDVHGWEYEVFIRGHRDGNAFLRLFAAPEGVTWRAVEPDQIRPPLSEPHEGPWSFGILTDVDDWATPQAYSIYYWQDRHEIVPAAQMVHLKLNVDKQRKFGVSSFWPVFDDLENSARLRWAWREGEKARSSIAYIRQHQMAELAQVRAFQQKDVTHNISLPLFSGHTMDMEMSQQYPGRVEDIPFSLEYKEPPQIKGDSAAQAIQKSLEAVAARFCVPYWLVSGIDASSSYASAFVVNGPFLRRILQEQRIMASLWRELYRKAADLEIAAGRLPPGFLEGVKLHISGPMPQIAERKDSIEADLMLVQAGVMSRHTLAAKNDLNYSEELAEMREEDRLAVERLEARQ